MNRDRLEREREFHDARFSGAAGDHARRFHVINAASDRFFKAAIEQVPRGARLLDYGCGDAAYCAMHAAQQGHEVTAVDLSPVAVAHAREKAEGLGIADRIDFRVENAEELELPEDSFDVVSGLGIIHHLDLERSIGEVARVLKPDGHAVFVEPMGHNPAINLYRRRTPGQRTPDEHPLLIEDVELIRSHFEESETTYFHLLGLLAIPFRGRSIFDTAVRVLDASDRALFRRVKAARRYAWKVGLKLARPKPLRPSTDASR